jgi:hypothetical protein
VNLTGAVPMNSSIEMLINLKSVIIIEASKLYFRGFTAEHTCNFRDKSTAKT